MGRRRCCWRIDGRDKLQETSGQLQKDAHELHAEALFFAMYRIQPLEQLASAHRREGDNSRTLDLYDQSSCIREAMHDELGMATRHTSMVGVLDDAGDVPAALEYYQKGLRLRERIGDHRGVAISYNNLAGIYFLRTEVKGEISTQRFIKNSSHACPRPRVGNGPRPCFSTFR